MLYQAHRGVQKEYPENTMASIRAAKEQGYDIIEIDPAVTKDGVLVLMHDDTSYGARQRRAGSGKDARRSRYNV